MRRKRLFSHLLKNKRLQIKNCFYFFLHKNVLVNPYPLEESLVFLSYVSDSRFFMGGSETIISEPERTQPV